MNDNFIMSNGNLFMFLHVAVGAVFGFAVGCLYAVRALKD